MPDPRSFTTSTSCHPLLAHSISFDLRLKILLLVVGRYPCVGNRDSWLLRHVLVHNLCNIGWVIATMASFRAVDRNQKSAYVPGSDRINANAKHRRRSANRYGHDHWKPQSGRFFNSLTYSDVSATIPSVGNRIVYDAGRTVLPAVCVTGSRREFPDWARYGKDLP